MSRLPVIPLGSFLLPQTRSALGHTRHFSTSNPHLPLLRHLHPAYPFAPTPLRPWFPARVVPQFFPHPALFFGPNFRPISSTNGNLRMERPETEREPPQKRRRSAEERTKTANPETTEGRSNCQHQWGRQGGRDKSRDRTEKSRDAQNQNQHRTLAKNTTEERLKEREEGSDPWIEDGAERHVGPLQRQWDLSPLGHSDRPPPVVVNAGFDFTVMSYNILSQDLLLDNAYLYQHCDPAVLRWDYRMPRLLREIEAHDADILCLQEVQEDHFVDQIQPALEALGYQCEYKKRTGHKSDGCAVVFKSSRLSLLSSNPVEFYRGGDALLDRDNVGLVVRLSPTSDPASCICVANTHLLYNPRRGDIKLAQLAILLAEVNRMSHLPDGSTNPVLLCGDLNSTPWSPLYRFLTTGQLDYKGMSIGMVSGQESHSRAQRLLCCPLWSDTLGISSSCQYQDLNRDPIQDTNQDPNQDLTQSEAQGTTADSACISPTAVVGAISHLTVEDQTLKPTQDISKRWRVSHSLKLRSSYSHRLSPDGREEITTCHSRTAMTVDYILYTPDSPVGSSSSSLPGGRGLQLLGRLSLVGRPELEQVNGLPNEHHSSDHLPLLARFRLWPR